MRAGVVQDPYWLERGRDRVEVGRPAGGHASTLPMTDEQLEAAREREKTKVVGFTVPPADPPVIGLA